MLVIPFSKGVCGAAARENHVQLVDDVHAFPGHIACSSSTLSEIVLRAGWRRNVIAVFDIDGNNLLPLRQMMSNSFSQFWIRPCGQEPDHEAEHGSGDLDSLIW